MVSGKTSSGFAFNVNRTVIDDMRIVDAVAEVADGSNPVAISFLVKTILGEEGKKALYEHLQEEDGRVPLTKVSNEITEILRHLEKKEKTDVPCRNDRNR